VSIGQSGANVHQSVMAPTSKQDHDDARMKTTIQPKNASKQGSALLTVAKSGVIGLPGLRVQPKEVAYVESREQDN